MVYLKQDKGGNGRLFKKILRLCLWLGLAGIAAFACLYAAVPLELDLITRIDASPALYDAEGRLFHLKLSPDSEWQIPIKLSDMGR